MQILTDAQLADLVSRASLLEGELNKPKVLLDANGYIYKFFYQPGRKLSPRNLSHLMSYHSHKAYASHKGVKL